MRNIREIMTPNPEIINFDSTIKDAAEKMDSLNVGFLPVVENDNPIGVITDRDIVTRCIAHGHNPNDTKVSDCITREPKFIFEDSSIDEAANLMREHKIRRTLVVDENKKPVGILSLGDLVTEGNSELAAETLEILSHPSEPNRS